MQISSLIRIDPFFYFQVNIWSEVLHNNIGFMQVDAKLLCIEGESDTDGIDKYNLRCPYDTEVTRNPMVALGSVLRCQHHPRCTGITFLFGDIRPSTGPDNVGLQNVNEKHPLEPWQAPALHWSGIFRVRRLWRNVRGSFLSKRSLCFWRDDENVRKVTFSYHKRDALFTIAHSGLACAAGADRYSVSVPVFRIDRV
jgi:hypothetical protein